MLDTEFLLFALLPLGMDMITEAALPVQVAVLPETDMDPVLQVSV